jgi:alanine dehydrogenase
MLLGVPKEIKNHEYRVGLTPASVREVVQHGHQVLIERNAGLGIGATDEDYRKAGATVVDSADEVFARSEMVVKVKEPQAAERARLRAGQILFTYLHLAPDPEQTKDLIQSGATCIAYETVTSPSGGLPLLAPMSEVAGRMSIQAAAHCLEREAGGMGVLLGGVPGVEGVKVVVLGGGVVGANAEVVVIDRSVDVLRGLVRQFGTRVRTLASNVAAIETEVTSAAAVIGGVLIPGAAAPKLVSRDMVKAMKPGAVVVDVAIDQGGCFETSRATTHAAPTYLVDGVVHYCVANMPGAVPRTSTYALNNATLPFVLALADKGWKKALAEDRHLANGLNVHEGKITCAGVSDALGYAYHDPRTLLGA